MNSTEYEKLTQEVYRALLISNDRINTIDVKHNVELVGRSGQKHQIDVFWEFEMAGVKYQTAIECKNYNGSVSVGKIRDFSAVLSDVGNINGIFVTTVGFQSGAIRFADHYKINLIVVRPPTEKDWEGRLRSIHLKINGSSATNIRQEFILDDEWMKTNYPIRTEFKLSGFQDELFIVRLDGSKISSLHDLESRLAVGKFESVVNENRVFELGDDAFIIDNSGKSLKIKAISYTFDIQVSTHTASINGDRIAKAIMIDVQSGKRVYPEFCVKSKLRRTTRLELAGKQGSASLSWL